MYSSGAFAERFIVSLFRYGILAFAIAMSLVLGTDSLLRVFATEDSNAWPFRICKNSDLFNSKDRWPTRLSEVDLDMVIVSHPIGSNL